jgi:hypothetical protein
LGGGLGSKRSLACPSSPLLETTARQLAYCILQAHEYYRAAETVTIHTSPLLYFYGMLSLAKALIVANEPSTVLDDIKYHGLKSDRSVQPAKLEEQAAVAAGGVFERLCSVIQKSGCPPGAVIKLKDVLSISPELGEVYERFFQEPPRSLGDYDTQVTSTSPFRMRVMTARTAMQELLKRFPEVANDFELDLAPVHGYAVAFHSRPHVTEPPGYFKRYVGVVGGKYLVGTLPIFSDGTLMKLWISPPPQ